MKWHHFHKHFTFTEFMIALIMIELVAAAILFSLGSGISFANESDDVRRENITALSNALAAYKEMQGNYPIGIDDDASTGQVLGVSGNGCNLACGAIATQVACLDITGALVDEHLAAIPFDPESGDFLNTDYYINKTASGKTVVGACDPQNIAAINIIK